MFNDPLNLEAISRTRKNGFIRYPKTPKSLQLQKNSAASFLKSRLGVLYHEETPFILLSFFVSVFSSKPLLIFKYIYIYDYYKHKHTQMKKEKRKFSNTFRAVYGNYKLKQLDKKLTLNYIL